MTRDKAVDMIMKRCGYRTKTSLRDDIITEMAYVQKTLLEGGPVMPWFLLSDERKTTTVANDARVRVPPDFINEWEETELYLYKESNTDDKYKELHKDDWDYIKDKYPGSGEPSHYDLKGSFFMLAPIPDDEYELRFWHYARADDLGGTYGDSNNIENCWLKWAPDLLIAETGVIIGSQYLQSEALAGRFEKQAKQARDRLWRRNTAIREENKNRLMGDL